MKCSCCELVIEDEGEQVSHTERCHPELLRKRWEESGTAPMDLAAQFIGLYDKYPPLEAVIDDCLYVGYDVDMKVTKAGAMAYLSAPVGKRVSGSGETLYAALNLAKDRVKYTK